MKKTAIAILLGITLPFSTSILADNSESKTTQNSTALTAELPVVEAELTFAPNVPKPINRKEPARVVVKLEALEKVMEIMGGVQFKYWTFNGATPAPFIRVREGDTVEVHLSNPVNSKMEHSIDFHSAAAPEGGAIASNTKPGRTSVFAFQALQPGLYLYHCAAFPGAATHIGKGMFGLMLVEPKEGLPDVDKEFYIVQNEFYTNAGFGEKGLHVFSMEKASYELPDYVVFNGHYGSMMGEDALKAKVGDKIRFFVGNAGPNKISSFHLIGKPFDTVYIEGGTLQNHNVQTTLIPAGGATIAEAQIQVPGQYTFLDHSIFRADKGAKGMLIVEGKENPAIYSGKIKDEAYDKRNPDADVEVDFHLK
ncbi:dissimilatory nitrite reductase (NO-forming) copper type apoprotein [Pasteurella langaaensis DSM 22999]|uniref:Copper-containing nitrite reductase n=1 Tax=Alitibacter langaaensis DSM 22999 TaxID=1122935 RepID=A0A2U0SNU0_9PAST|nr:copper-containing nitrite reductase [Pasteurella langaaensis]PVX33020.1 dissimilatory nitrite reductase (NO-forming) copper type apoprotein [Pasteurella langaaensis DSM 22999]